MEDNFSIEYIKMLFLLGSENDKKHFILNQKLNSKCLIQIYNNDLNSDHDFNLKNLIIEHNNFNWTSAQYCLKYEYNPSLKNALILKKITHYPVFTCPRLFYLLIKNFSLIKSSEVFKKIYNCILFILLNLLLIYLFKLPFILCSISLIVINSLWYVTKGFQSKLWKKIMKQYRNILFIMITLCFLSVFVPLFMVSIIAFLFEPKKYYFYTHFL